MLGVTVKSPLLGSSRLLDRVIPSILDLTVMTPEPQVTMGYTI